MPLPCPPAIPPCTTIAPGATCCCPPPPWRTMASACRLPPRSWPPQPSLRSRTRSLRCCLACAAAAGWRWRRRVLPTPPLGPFQAKTGLEVERPLLPKAVVGRKPTGGRGTEGRRGSTQNTGWAVLWYLTHGGCCRNRRTSNHNFKVSSAVRDLGTWSSFWVVSTYKKRFNTGSVKISPSRLNQQSSSQNGGGTKTATQSCPPFRSLYLLMIRCHWWTQTRWFLEARRGLLQFVAWRSAAQGTEVAVSRAWTDAPPVWRGLHPPRLTTPEKSGGRTSSLTGWSSSGWFLSERGRVQRAVETRKVWIAAHRETMIQKLNSSSEQRDS